MQTVNFQCGSCNNLMGVSSEFLGRQVRCPHCQAVVVAPAAAAAPETTSADAVAFVPAPDSPQDDIFAPPEPTDDLFGDGGIAARRAAARASRTIAHA